MESFEEKVNSRLDDNGEINVKDVLDLFWRLKWWIRGAMFLALVLGFFYVRLQTPVYERTAAVMLTVYALYCYFSKPAPALHMRDLAVALVLVMLAVITMATLAVVFATRLSPVANLTLCNFIFFLGLISGYLQKQASDYFRSLGSEYEIFDLLSGVFYAVLPNWQFFWLVDTIAMNRPVPWSYVGWAALYVFLYTLLASLWAVAVFQNREPAGDARD